MGIEYFENTDPKVWVEDGEIQYEDELDEYAERNEADVEGPSKPIDEDSNNLEVLDERSVRIGSYKYTPITWEGRDEYRMIIQRAKDDFRVSRPVDEVILQILDPGKARVNGEFRELERDDLGFFRLEDGQEQNEKKNQEVNKNKIENSE